MKGSRMEQSLNLHLILVKRPRSDVQSLTLNGAFLMLFCGPGLEEVGGRHDTMIAQSEFAEFKDCMNFSVLPLP